MSQIWQKVAAVLAFGIGAMAIFAGVQVLLGNDPGYYVINWVPVYNYTAGVLTVATTAVLLWRGHPLGRILSVITLVAHGAVLVILLTAYRAVVAPDSIRAMVVRLSVWTVILVLVGVQMRWSRRAAAPAPNPT